MMNKRLESALAWCKKNDLELIRLKKFNRESKKRRSKKKKLFKKKRRFFKESWILAYGYLLTIRQIRKTMLKFDILSKKELILLKHRIYTGRLFTKHLFVEIKKDLFCEWDLDKIENITKRDIARWLIHERNNGNKTLLMTLPFIKRGCKDLSLIKMI